MDRIYQDRIDSDFFCVGEFWKDKVEKNSSFSEKMNHILSSFDVPLHYNFFRASTQGNSFDLSSIRKGSFLQQNPMSSISFVGNQNTQNFRRWNLQLKIGSDQLLMQSFCFLEMDIHVFSIRIFSAEYTSAFLFQFFSAIHHLLKSI